jgi:hypothetical protein
MYGCGRALSQGRSGGSDPPGRHEAREKNSDSPHRSGFPPTAWMFETADMMHQHFLPPFFTYRISEIKNQANPTFMKKGKYRRKIKRGLTAD